MRSSRLHHPTLLWLACLLLLLPTGRSSTAVKRGLCEKHGAHGVCIAAGCNEGAAERNKEKRSAFGIVAATPLLSKAHVRDTAGAPKECKVKECGTLSVKHGLCYKHGAHGTCHSVGCTANAAAGFLHRIAHGGGKKSRAGLLHSQALQARASVPNTVVVTVSARWTAAPLLHRNVVSVPSTVRTEHASPMAALPTQQLGFYIASLTAAGRRIKPCPDHPGCIVPSRSKGICFKHVGGYGGCWIVGCTSKMAGGLMVCSKLGGKGHSQSLYSLVFLQIPRVP